MASLKDKHAYRFFLLLCCLVLFQKVHLFAQNLPNPQSFVNDFAGVMQPQEKENLRLFLEEFEKKTTTEIAVVTVATTAPLDVFTYRVKLFKKWGVGKEGKDNGLLVLLALKERRLEVEVGYGLEGILPDARVGSVLRERGVPYLKKGMFGKGLAEVVHGLAKVIEKEPPQSLGGKQKVLVKIKRRLIYFFLQGGSGVSRRGWGAISGAVFLLFGLFFYFRRTKCPRCGRRGAKERVPKLVAKPTRSKAGLKKRIYDCKYCGEGVEQEEVIPQSIVGSSHRTRRCFVCAEKKFVKVRTSTVKSATTYSEGSERIECTCQCCGNKWSYVQSTSRLSTSSDSSWSSSGGSFGGFGGGSSGGGGAGVSF